jgi:hypothetical protein
LLFSNSTFYVFFTFIHIKPFFNNFFEEVQKALAFNLLILKNYHITLFSVISLLFIDVAFNLIINFFLFVPLSSILVISITFI